VKSSTDVDFDKIVSDFSDIDMSDDDADKKIKSCVDDIIKNEKFDLSSVYNELLINEYILNVFNSKPYTNNSSSYLKNEAEYIIFGKDSDDKNANYMKALVIAIRYVFNLIYIYNDDGIVLAADIAACIATAIVLFYGQGVVKNLILLGWCFVESWEDYDLLAQGKPVPLYKTSETWKTWFNYDKNATGKISLTYKDYLRIFLLFVPEDLKLARILDLIQLNVSKERGTFNVLNTVTNITVSYEIIFDGKRRVPAKLEVSYGY